MGRRGYASGVKRRARTYACHRGRMCFGRDATPWFGRLLTDKRLHHFASVFVLKCCINVLPFWHFRSVTQKRDPPLPPFSMLWSMLGGAVCFRFASCLSTVFLSHEHPPILNLVGSGEARYDMLMLVLLSF